MFESLTVFEKELAILWEENNIGYIDLVHLRKSCPCAWCTGEKDVFGNIYRGEKSSLPAQSFKIASFEKVGLYGIRFFWEDGHRDGIYTITLLRSLETNEK